jgi:multiple sugar transport system substrate-binding protein
MPDRAVGGTSRRDFLRWTVLAGAAVGLAGCGGSGTPQADTGPALDGGGYTGPRVEIRYWHGFTGGDGPAMARLVQEFNNSQDNIRVLDNTIQWADYYQRVVAAVHAGKGPDVGAMHVEQLASQASRQTISPLDDVVGELGLEASSYPEQVWDQGVFGDARYGIPFDVHSLGSYANMQLLAQAGITAQPQTGAELEQALAALTQAGVNEPFWVPNRWPAHLIFLSLLWQFGGEPYAEDGSEATFDSEEGVAALTWMTDQIEKGYSPPNVAVDSQYTAFKNGEGAFTWDGIWQINDVESTDLDWSLAPVPTIGEEPAVWANSHQLVMYRHRTPNDDKLQASKVFIKFLTENSEAWTAAGMIPAAAEARETPEFQESPQAAIAEAIPSMRFLPAIPALGEVQAQTLEIGLSNAILGLATPEEALQAAAAQATALMQGNLAKFGV